MNSMSGSTGNKLPKGYSQGQLQQFTPEMMQLFQQLFAHVGPDSFLNKLASGDQSMFEQMEKPALKQFGQLQGGLASKFSGMGLGARKSSGFQNTMNSATSDFAQNLQSQRQNMQMEAIKQLMGMSGDLLNQKPYENFMIKKEHKKPFWQEMLGLISPVGGDIASGGTENTQNFLKATSSFM